jgi:HemY protein
VIRFFIYSIVALGLGATLALLLAADPGYLLINFRGTTVEATLATVIVTVLLIIVLGVASVWLLRLLNPAHLFGHGWFSRAPADTSANALQLLLLGRWQEAYKIFVENAERMDVPELNYLLAAVAAYQRGDRPSWQWCLDQAERKSAGTAQGIKSFRALLETRAGHPDQGLALLLALLRLAPASPFVLTQIKDIYVAHGRWDELASLLPELEKQKVVDADELRALTEKVHIQRLEQASITGVESLRLAWHDLPKALKQNEKLIDMYLRKLLQYGQDTEAGALLTSVLKKEWNDNLVGMLGFVHVRNPQEALLMMETWLKQRPNNPVLLLTLGRLSLRNQLWGKGREYFELALRVTNSPELVAEINAELARLLEHLGERDKSLACYQKALGMMKYPLPDLPLPIKR